MPAVRRQDVRLCWNRRKVVMNCVAICPLTLFRVIVARNTARGGPLLSTSARDKVIIDVNTGKIKDSGSGGEGPEYNLKSTCQQFLQRIAMASKTRILTIDFRLLPSWQQIFLDLNSQGY